MIRHVWTLNLGLRTNFLFINSKRFKGHSHWQNIRHVKQASDSKRCLQMSMYMRKLQGIVNANNGDTNPETNSGLATVLQQAKKENLNVGTLQNYLKKMKDRDVTPTQMYLKGEEKYVIAITYDKRRQAIFRQAIKRACRDHKMAMLEISKADDVFTTKGVIISKAPKKTVSLTQAEEDAIVAGAEEVDEIPSTDKEESVFQFITLHDDLWTVVKSLKEQGWTMYEHKHELVPLYCIDLPEDKMSQLHDFVTALEDIPEVDKVVVNIA